MPSNPPIQTQKLANGLPVLVVSRPGNLVVTVDIWVGTGSADETPAVNGVSHFLEHMLFKGTRRHGVGEIDRIVEGLGGYLNAGTSHDFTHYYITSASENFQVSLDILGDVIQNSTLDPGELDSERQVILEEYHRKQDDPHGILWDTLYERAFEKSPYKAPVLGVPDTINAINHDSMKDYYHRNYTPGNMVLAIVGDVQADEAFDAARSVFQDFDRPHRPLVDPNGVQTVYSEGIRETVEKDINETYGVLAFPTQGLVDHRETYALDVLQFVLGGGHASLLFQEIKEKRRLATSITAGYSGSRHPDLFFILYTCQEKNRADLEEAVLEQLEKVRQAPVVPKDLDRARKLLVNAHAFSLETTSGQSSSIGYYHTITGAPDFEWNYAEGIRSVTADEVRDRAEKILNPQALNCLAVRPKQ